MAAVTAELIAIGDELIEGLVVDTNSAHLARELASVGIEVARVTAVPDDEEDVFSAVSEALARRALVVTTGGLGPTVDDRTRQAIAGAVDRPLTHSPEAERCVREHLARHGVREVSPAQMSQAMVPEGCEVLGNPLGSAAGFLCRARGSVLVCLPGVPSEMKAIVRAHLLPALRRLFPQPLHIRRRVVGIACLPESKVNEGLRDLMESADGPRVGVMVSPGVVRVVVTARGRSEADAASQAQSIVEEIRSRFGRSVYCDDGATPAAALGRALGDRGLTLALAESCTGGLIGKLVTDVPGSSKWFRGGVVAYSNDAKVELLRVPRGLIERCGAVSREVAEAMAQGAVEAFSADYALAVTGIAGPGGGSEKKPVGLVYGALASGKSGVVRSAEWRFSGTRENIRARAAVHALDMCRLAVVP